MAMWSLEDYFEQQQHRYELVPTRTGLWSVHDREEHTYTWGMTLDEATHYLRRQGIDIKEVTVCN